LPLAAQQVIAQVHPQTVPASRVLESEGLRYQGYVDIFDAGPTLEAEVKNLRAVKESQTCAVKIVSSLPEATGRYLVANDRYHDYRAILIQHAADADNLSLTAEQAYALGVQAGQSIRMLPLDKME